MNTIIIIICIFIAIVFDVVSAFWFCKIAELKGYDSKSYHIFARCFWFGFIGYLYVIGLPDKSNQENDKSNQENNEQKVKDGYQIIYKENKKYALKNSKLYCPYCYSILFSENSTRCSYCGKDLKIRKLINEL